MNIGSVLGQLSTPLMGWYDGGKHALEAVNDALRLELVREGVQVVLIEPGAIRSPIWEKAREDMERHEGSAYADSYRRWGQLTRALDPLFSSPEAVARRWRPPSRPSGHRRYYVGLGTPVVPWLYRLAPPALRDPVLRLVHLL